MSAARLSIQLARLQHEWLSGARSRLLRAASIQQAKSIVDLGCGWGLSTVELAERSGASVVGVDLHDEALQFARAGLCEALASRVTFMRADAAQIPVDSETVDLIFVQCSLLWMPDPIKVLEECRRLLSLGGRLVLIEPDFGGLMEWPSNIATRELWLDVLKSAGADPLIGRKLPILLRQALFRTSGYFLDRYETPATEYLQFLGELPMSDLEGESLRKIQQSAGQLGPEKIVVHLPYWMQIASKNSDFPRTTLVSLAKSNDGG